MPRKQCCGVNSRPIAETLRQRVQRAIGQIEFHALDTVHGKEHYAGRRQLAILYESDQIVK
jgi:hypothetical protein